MSQPPIGALDVTGPVVLPFPPAPPAAATFHDSGTRSEFATGAVRDGQEGKGRFDLLPFGALLAVARVFEVGAAKYAERNWEKGIPTHRYLDSALRHTLKHLDGQRDEPHAAMACWNLLCLMETQQRIADGRLPAELETLPPPRALSS